MSLISGLKDFKLEPGDIYVKIDNGFLSYITQTPNGDAAEGKIALSELSSLPISSSINSIEQLIPLLSKILEITSRRGHTVDLDNPVIVKWEYGKNQEMELSISHTEQTAPVVGEGTELPLHGNGQHIIKAILGDSIKYLDGTIKLSIKLYTPTPTQTPTNKVTN